MNPIGQCLLCHTSGVPLINSHIVSKWVYRRIISYDPSKGTDPIALDGGKAGFSAKQETEPLLCRRCEDLLGLWENYVAKAGLQADGKSFPLRDQATVVQTLGDMSVATLEPHDVDMVARFALSVLWRADVAQSEPIISLGGLREPVRAYLRGGSFPSDAALVVTLLRVKPGYPRVDRMLAWPASSDDMSSHDFLACGMRFTLYAAPVSPALRSIDLVQTKSVVVSSGESILRAVAEEVQTSTTYGKLATKS